MASKRRNSPTAGGFRPSPPSPTGGLTLIVQPDHPARPTLIDALVHADRPARVLAASWASVQRILQRPSAAVVALIEDAGLRELLAAGPQPTLWLLAGPAADDANVVTLDAMQVGSAVVDALLADATTAEAARMVLVARDGDALADRLVLGIRQTLARRGRQAETHYVKPAAMTAEPNLDALPWDAWADRGLLRFVATDDALAADLLSAVARRRWPVPGRVAVVGIGNDGAIAPLTDPPLTSLPWPSDAMAETMLRWLDDPTQPLGTIRLSPPPIEWRDSLIEGSS